MQNYMLGINLFGIFHRDRRPHLHEKVLSMKQMRIGDGEQLPSYRAVSQYFTVNIRVTIEKSH